MSKIQNSTFVRITKKNIQVKVETIQKWFEGGVAFWSFGSQKGPMLTKMKNIRKKIKKKN